MNTPTPPRRPPIDLIALDLDGTLLAQNETISPGNRAAIAKALTAGIRVVLVTGRGVDVPIAVSRELGLNLPVICCHGALTKDFAADRTLVHIPVPLQYALPMIEYAEAEQLAVAVYAEEYFWRRESMPTHMADMLGPAWRQVPSLLDVLKRGSPTFLRFFGQPVVEAVMSRFGDLPLSFRYETFFELAECVVLSRDASKRNALLRLCADFGVSRERVLAIGDSRNDVPMLQWAGKGVATGNALPEVRQAVPYVTGNNDADGVAAAIERFCFSSAKKSA